MCVPLEGPRGWSTPCFPEPLVTASTPWQMLVSLYIVFASALFSVYEVCLSPLLRTVLPRSVSWISSAKTPYKSTFSVPWCGLVSSESPSSAYYSMLRVNSYYIAMQRLGKIYCWVTKKWKNNNSKREIQKPLGETVYILLWLQKEKMTIIQALSHTDWESEGPLNCVPLGINAAFCLSE